MDYSGVVFTRTSGLSRENQVLNRELAMKRRRKCIYCGELFKPSIFHPDQQVCSSEDCRRRQRREDRCNRYHTDLVYRQVCLESTLKWRERNPGYQSNYRRQHPNYVAHNRQAQRERDRRLRLGRLVKNNLAIAVKPRPARVWLVGSDFAPLVKNNLAFSEVVIFQGVAAGQVRSP